MDASKIKQLRRLRRILEVREGCAQMQAARLNSAIIAGSALRADLVMREHPAAFADLTVRSVFRTIGVIDRGLCVLRQQQREALLGAQRARQASDVAASHLEELQRRADRKCEERTISEVACGEAGRAGAARLR